MQCEECQTTLWKAGEMAPAGRYIRQGDASGRVLALEQPGFLPAAFDGHIALYHQAGFQCACMQRVSDDLMPPRRMNGWRVNEGLAHPGKRREKAAANEGPTCSECRARAAPA